MVYDALYMKLGGSTTLTHVTWIFKRPTVDSKVRFNVKVVTIVWQQP